MPLVVPGIMTGGDKTSDWSNKLVGKKIGDSHDEIVSSLLFFSCALQLEGEINISDDD